MTTKNSQSTTTTPAAQQLPQSQSSRPICRIIDLADTDIRSISRQIDLALREHGFFYIQNHGISQDLIDKQFAISRQIFDLPVDVKTSMPFNPTLDIGYLGSGLQAVGLTKQSQSSQLSQQSSSSQIDIKEQFMMTNNRLITTSSTSNGPKVLLGDDDDDDDHDGTVEDNSTTTRTTTPKRSPVLITDEFHNNNTNNHNKKNHVFVGSLNYLCDFDEHYDVASQYATAVYNLNHKLQSYLAQALQLTTVQEQQLGITDVNTVMTVTTTDNERTATSSDNDDDSCAITPFFMVLKQMKYQSSLPSNPHVGRYGAGPHTDWGSFTILATDQTPGLQVFLEDEEPERGGGRGNDGDGGGDSEGGGRWVDVPPIDGCLIVNAGDQISCLTSGIYKSALHRVLIFDVYVNRPRYSTACFCYFAMDSTFQPLPQFCRRRRRHRQEEDNNDEDDDDDPSQGRTTREYFHYKLHQSVSLV
jgi:isopenicillin N synthase-like dioxygenase